MRVVSSGQSPFSVDHVTRCSILNTQYADSWTQVSPHSSRSIVEKSKLARSLLELTEFRRRSLSERHTFYYVRPVPDYFLFFLENFTWLVKKSPPSQFSLIHTIILLILYFYLHCLRTLTKNVSSKFVMKVDAKLSGKILKWKRYFIPVL